MTLTEFTSIATAIAVVGGGTLWLETRYVQRGDVEALIERTEELEGAVERGHKAAELRSNIYGVQNELDDLQGRSVMYRAFDQAGVITPEQRNRWTEVEDAISAKRGELATLNMELQRLQ